MTNVVHIPDRLVALAGATIVDALATWATWTCAMSFAGPSGDATLDAKLGKAFAALIGCGGFTERLRWIEAELFTLDDFPSPARPADAYRTTLIHWWLDLYASRQPIDPENGAPPYRAAEARRGGAPTPQAPQPPRRVLP